MSHSVVNIPNILAWRVCSRLAITAVKINHWPYGPHTVVVKTDLKEKNVQYEKQKVNTKEKIKK